MKTQNTEHKTQTKHKTQNTKHKPVCVLGSLGFGFCLCSVQSGLCAFRSRGGANGFTLIEILLVVGILTLIGAVSIASFVNSRNVRELNTSGQNLLSVLRLAQSRVLAGEGSDTWGVRLEQARYILFQGTDFASSGTTTIYTLPDNLEIVNINLSGGGQEVVFKKLTGETEQAGTFDLRIKNSATLTYPITIESSGKVFRTGTAPVPLGTRIVDTRHRSFNLGWSIKNSIILTLTFSDPPNPDTVVPVAMAGYFNSDKTKFDLTITTIVGSLPQTQRIHTTSLTDTNTILSVDRDCRRNNKQMLLAIDARDIATYSADCQTVTVGAWGGTISEP